MLEFEKVRKILIGSRRDPLNPDTRGHIVLVAFLAWIGLGADGLSSSCYGPEEAFLALGHHTHLGLYLALVTAITVFIISVAYNQVIELFPSGGGGYKVATQLIGPYAGLISGSALIVDYMLTISISIASGIDAMFSLFPASMLHFKLASEIFVLFVLILLNLRGMKESIQILMPIFLGFFLTHAFLISYGIWTHSERLATLIPETLGETTDMSRNLGWVFIASLFLRAYSLGGGTYTGIEAVSNNVNMLAEPRVKTGKWTMFYMASSLSFTAAGIILLYLIWHVKPVEGQTLNAVAFQAIFSHLDFGTPFAQHAELAIVMALEAGLLLVAANTGFLGGPMVMANMAADSWVPRQFGQLSSRLVTQNGILMMGIAAFFILLWTKGEVSLLVVLYSINVFLTFSMSIFGLCLHWWRNRRGDKKWLPRFLLSLVGLCVTSSILVVTTVEKFMEGGWMTILITLLVIAVFLLIHRHYEETRVQLRKVDELYSGQKALEPEAPPPQLDPSLPTAVFLSGKNRGLGMHALLWVLRMFPGHFKNFIFVAVGEVDLQSYDGEGALRTLKYKIENSQRFYVNFCHQHGLAATAFEAYGTDPLEELFHLTEKIMKDYPLSICFASKLIFVHDNIFTRWLHNQTAVAMQRRLHLQGQQMVILPMKLDM